MNRQEEEYFRALTTHRSGLATALEDPAMSGVRTSVVEKYSDQAHFVYELLQNADDAEATSARFVLEKNRLVFSHNGKRHFSITDPKKEKEDSERKLIGDINSITSIANSNKTSSASIGKFGVGFKAVFQYTSTPHIYDSNFRFKIDRFIVPILIEEDFPGRKEDETLFVFPFDHPERGAAESYEDISGKLRNLSYPLLFLTKLKNIEFSFEGTLGLYGKTVKEKRIFGQTEAEYIVLTQNDGEDFYEEHLWLFSRVVEQGESVGETGSFKYSVGFFMDEDGKLRAVNKPAFCFFPTKEVTGLNFIIHAPFLLTDSREGIRAGNTHNEKMIRLLAELSADAMCYLRDIGIEESHRLIDDDIISIIPIDPSSFSEVSDKSRISFKPFYSEIKKAFQKEELIPTIDGYVKKENAYWAAIPQIAQVFSDTQLGQIVDNPRAKWVFTTISRDQRNNAPLIGYLDELVRTNLSEDHIISGRTKGYYRDGQYQNLESVKGINDSFIESQSIEWLHIFYKWLAERSGRTKAVKNKAIFIDQYGKAAPALDANDEHVLFLPVEGMDMRGYRVVNPELLTNSETRAFIEGSGIKAPSLKDQIYNLILPQYQDGEDIDTNPHFLLFFKFYLESSQSEVDKLISLIKDCAFLTYYSADNEEMYRGEAESIYLPSKELVHYFESKPDTRFLDIDGYKKLVGAAQEAQLFAFLKRLGVNDEIKVIENEIDIKTTDRTDLPNDRSTRESITSWREWVLDGCKEIVADIVENKDTRKSVLLWNTLIRVTKNRCSSWNCRDLESLIKGSYRYFFNSVKEKPFYSSDCVCLRKKAWVVADNGEFVCPEGMDCLKLSAEYDTVSPEAKGLMKFIGIIFDEGDNLTSEQRKKITLANQLIAAGIEDEKVLQDLIRKYKNGNAGHLSKNPEYSIEIDDDTSPNVRNVVGDIVERVGHNEKKILSEESLSLDADEYTPSAVDFNKKIEQAKEKSALEIERITQYAELQERAENAEKYSYGWFKALLEMECINSSENNNGSKEISIAFSRVEREPGTQRMLVLKYPSRYIPQFMEELADVPLVLHVDNQVKTVAIEVASVKSYTLRVKMKSEKDVEGIDLEKVTSATIDAKSPTFLMEELKKQFFDLGYEDDFNMQQNLCSNIEFVFGPPGTGKTTHLAKNVLLPMMQENPKCKVLVLTPTNKSSDVLVRRIMEICGDDHSYNKWLVRFGATSDETIENSPVYRDKTFDLLSLSQSVTVTTIARFPYDFFMPQGKRYFLYGMDWDYIVIDEASMIPLANIVFPLYKKTPQKFIIAGDPFQIEPIASVALWKDQNIYTMVQLDSFTNPRTIPHQYKVELLTTQYRSVPDIGYIFSNFAYGGILKHYRTSESQRALNVGNDLGIETLNIIKFPTSKYESIFRCKRLQSSSSYQIYSALFTFEYVCFLADAISQNNPDELFKIGIIAPYRAQADLIEKLIASERFPKEVDVQVGTIHGFQGDECDIIFAVFNTPPTISSSREMFLNKKNIVNVSISRARDYLFVVMPDDETENISNLILVNRVKELINQTDAWNEFRTSDLEELMFDSPTYLLDNTFSTGHQNVNVYSLPEKCYEVRTEDSAVDIQIHKSSKSVVEQSEAERRNGSYDLNEDNIPEELRRDAIDVTVQGALNGWCYLVPYDGKLSGYTTKSTKSMFIPVIHEGQEKAISVNVIEEDRIVFIFREYYKKYEQELNEVEDIRLNKTISD